MNIAVIRNFIVEKEMVYALRRLGHKAVYIHLDSPMDAFKNIDFIFSTPWSHYPVSKVRKLKQKGIKVAYWSRSTPNADKQPKSKKYISTANKVFTCYHSKYNYLPLCASGNPKWDRDHEYKWDVCSVVRRAQNHPKLNKLTSIYFDMKRKHIVVGLGWNNIKGVNGRELTRYNNRYSIYWNSKLAINIPKSVLALPLRYFEASRCRCFPIFYNSPLLTEVFPEKRLVTFNEGTPNSKIYDLIDYYLDRSNRKEYRKTVKVFHEIVMKKHTFVNRMKKMIDVIT